MELWIRSQDKKLLVQAKGVKAEVFVGKKLYSPYTNEEIITFDGDDKFYVIKVNSKIVGEYKTEERCLEILDEIQKIMSGMPIFVKSVGELSKEDIERGLSLPVRTVCCNDTVCPLRALVYEMPEE